MLLNVGDLTEDQLKKIGLPPNPAGWNCFDTDLKEYCDAFWAIPGKELIPDPRYSTLPDRDDPNYWAIINQRTKEVVLPTLSWYPCCSNPKITVDAIPGDTFYDCAHCGMHADNYGIITEGKE